MISQNWTKSCYTYSLISLQVSVLNRIRNLAVYGVPLLPCVAEFVWQCEHGKYCQQKVKMLQQDTGLLRWQKNGCQDMLREKKKSFLNFWLIKFAFTDLNGCLSSGTKVPFTEVVIILLSVLNWGKHFSLWHVLSAKTNGKENQNQAIPKQYYC